jgi:ribosomal-protein-alanine N-acetyltransferase
MLVLKGFDPEDVGTMIKLVREAFGKDYSRDLFFEMGTLFPEEFMTVFDDSKLIGFLMGALTSPKEARVLIFVIDGQHRGKGIGSQVMSSFIDHCRKKGVERIRLEVKTTNENAIKLYRKFGFKAVDVLEKYYRDGNDGYLMYLEL